MRAILLLLLAAAGGRAMSITAPLLADGGFTIAVDGTPWVAGPGGPIAVRGGAGASLTPAGAVTGGSGADAWGKYTLQSLNWTDPSSGRVALETRVRVYDGIAAVAFDQTWHQPAPQPPAPRPRPVPGCPANCTVLPGYDQSGGREFQAIPNVTSEAECCQRCLAEPRCGVWVLSDPSERTCWLVTDTSTAFPRADRTAGFVRSKPVVARTGVVAAWPRLETAQPAGGPALNAVSFGGCQTSGSVVVPWSNTTSLSVAANAGMPLILFSAQGSAAMVGPASHFLVASHAALEGSGGGGMVVGAGIKATVADVPAGLTHTTLVRFGGTVTRAAKGWGDLLLALSGKRRLRSVDDPMLGFLTFWQDHGAWDYHNNAGYPNMQALIANASAGWRAMGVPFRAQQWDDWWMFSDGDVPGTTYWWPRPDVFPSGLTDWAGMPLSLYNPMYAWDNAYRNSSDAQRRYGFDWIRGTPLHGADTSLPSGRAFYDAIFANGTRAGMVMFEQDFLCTADEATNLTNADIDTGRLWLQAMADAADDAAPPAWVSRSLPKPASSPIRGASLQYCMMNPVHALESTRHQAVSNGRATRDNTHSDASNGLVLGVSSLLHFAVGLWPSRDNVWTTSQQPGCSEGDCTEPNVFAENAMALLAGGPYGPSDAPWATNVSMVGRTCRPDGALLRGDRPLTVLAPVLAAAVGAKDIAPLVWSTGHDADAGEGAIARWLYVATINTAHDTALSAHDVAMAGLEAELASAAWVAWDVEAALIGTAPGSAVLPSPLALLDDQHPLTIPACPAPSDAALLCFRLTALAPVLPSGWAFLGEPSRVAASSPRRVLAVSGAAGGALSASLALAANETAAFVARNPAGTLVSASCRAVGPCTAGPAGDDCIVTFACTADSECTCA